MATTTAKRLLRLPRAPEGGFAALAWRDTPCATDDRFARLRDDVETNRWLGWVSGIYAVTDYCARCDSTTECDTAATVEGMTDGIAGGHIWIDGERRI